MGRIDERFESLKKSGGKALIPFIMAGDPDLETTVELALVMADAGADIIEIGVPFSDPLADGPVIQRAGQRALGSGVGMREALSIAGRIRERSEIPILLLTYYNPVYRMGEEQFLRKAVEMGVDGAVIPDLPFEEGEYLRAAAQDAGFRIIQMIAPTTKGGRISMITGEASGFIYCVSSTGVTGMRKELSSEIKESVEAIRRVTALPIAVGFGISDTAQAREASRIADGVIIGSALVRMMEEEQHERERMLKRVGSFISQVKDSLVKGLVKGSLVKSSIS